MSSGAPQFATAEYSNNAGATTCKACGQKISGEYYRVDGVPACASCTERLKEQLPQDSHQAFGRAVLFGIAAAILGLVIYVGFALATGWVVGYVSLAVGYLVGKAVILGSRGAGGRRYQVAAVLLTYMAVSLAAVPIAISQHLKQRGAQSSANASAMRTPPPAQGNESATTARHMSVAAALGTLALLGLASPFLEMVDPMHGIIGLIILLVGIRIAWKITAGRKLDIAGPLSEPAAATLG